MYNFKMVLLHLIILCVYVCVWSGESLWELIFSFYHVGPEDRAHIIRVGVQAFTCGDFTPVLYT